MTTGDEGVRYHAKIRGELRAFEAEVLDGPDEAGRFKLKVFNPQPSDIHDVYAIRSATESPTPRDKHFTRG